MTKYIYGIGFFIFGLLLVCFGSKLSEFAIKNWYTYYPDKKICEKGYYILFYAAGIVFIIFGITVLVGIINLKK